MAGLFALSINPAAYKDDFSSDLFWGTFYHQHLGEQYAGLSSWNAVNNHMVIRTTKGLLRSSFDGNVGEFRGTEGIGYCGSERQPFRFGSKFGTISLIFSGNILNCRELIDEFKIQPGQTFERCDEVEIIAKLITQGRTIVDGLRIMAQRIEGAATVILLTEEGVYGFYGSDGHWPLVLGEKEGALAIASESAGFSNTGFSVKSNLSPGEIVFLQQGAIRYQDVLAERPEMCSFLWVYTNFVTTVIKGISSSQVRMRLGASLARRDIEKGFIPHIVFPIPDSGRFHALGYYWEFCRQMMLGKIHRIPLYFELLVKYPYAGRSFTPQTKEERDREARAKILPIGETVDSFLQEYFAGLEEIMALQKAEEIDAVGCDDSIVRGTQLSSNFVPKVKQIGIKRVHLRAANPELLCHCRWGKTTKRGEVIALQIPDLQRRAEHLGLTSLAYNTVEDLVGAIGLPKDQLCVDCDQLE